MREKFTITPTFLLSLCITFGSAFAADRYPFAHQQDARRFEQLTSELRCLVCQNQSLAESDAPLAQDLRMIVATQIRAGRDDQEITQFLVARYGDFIRYQPILSKATTVLWTAPFLLLFIGVGLLQYFKRKP